MSSRVAFLSTILVITLATSYSAIPLHNVTSVELEPVTTLQEFPEQRYFVYNSKQVTFFEAWQLCASFGLRLASVNTAEDDAALKVALRSVDPNEAGPWWIAGTDLGNDGHFVWITTTKTMGYKTGYTNFAPGEPNNIGNEHCVEAGWPGGTLWNNRGCDGRRRYVCETFVSEVC